MNIFYADYTPDADLVLFSGGHEFSTLAEIHLSGTEQREEAGFVVKEILRTGEWPVIPTRNGILAKPLRIVREGTSNREQGVIALSELVENFEKVGLNVQVPLSNDDDDHKNITALNTGYVRQIWLSEPDANGVTKLLAKIEFTEPDVRDKVLRGTYADVSCGIPWEITSRGQKFGTALEHVAITNRPFIDGLGPFLAMSDGSKQAEAVHFSTAEAVAEIESHVEPPQALIISPKQLVESAQQQIQTVFGDGYVVQHITVDGFAVRNDETKTSWTIPFEIKDGAPVLSAITEWTSTKDEEQVKPPEEITPPAPRSTPPAPANLPKGPEGELEAARRLREVRMGTSGQSTFTNRGGNMPLTREELEQLNLSELPEGQRAVFQKILDENSSLAASNRVKETDSRIAELETLGLKEFPGALTLYRSVMLSDDGGPAVVVLSDNGVQTPMTAKAILDQFIDAIKGAEGKVHLSDQALVSGSDIKPPETPEGEKKPLDERKAEAKAALYGGPK